MGLRCVRQAAMLLALLLFSQSGLTQDVELAEAEEKPAIRVASSVPAGFQYLLEKQTTAVDVFFGDVFLTTTLASYTPTTIEFHDPGDIIASLNNLLSPDQVEHGLSGEIDSHIGELCYRPSDVDCGKLAPEEVGVIFDEGRFRADVFINPNLLAMQHRTFDKFLPDPNETFSYLNNFSLLYSGDDGDNRQTALNTNSYLAYGRQRMMSRWSLNDGDSATASVEMLYWQMDQRGLQYQAGWFRSESRFLSFVPTVDLLGFRLSTSLKARTDLDYAKGTAIDLFLPNRSRVNIFKEGRFITSDFYEPGNQEIDTSRLPDGAYEIEIQIIDSSGQEEIINRFFVKSARIAPMDEPQYFFEVGDVQLNNVDTAFPESRNTAIAQAGYSYRLLPSLGLNLGGAFTENEALLEAGLYHLTSYFDVEPKLLLGKKGEYGYSLNGFARYQHLSASYSFRRTWSDNQALDSDDFYLIPFGRKQHNLSLSYPLYEGQLQFRYTNSSSDRRPSSTTTGLSYNRILPWRWLDGRFRFSTELVNSDEDRLFMLRLSWNRRSHHWYHNASTDIRSEKREGTQRDNFARASYSGTWSDRDLRDEDITVNWRAQTDENNSVLGVGGTWASERGHARLAVDHQDGSFGSRTMYAGELATSVSGTSETIAMGGKRFAESALIIDIGEQDTDSDFKVYINSAVYGTLNAGERVVVPVSPYQRVDVSIRDVGDDFVSFEKNNRSVVLFPGNVEHLKWQPRTLHVLVAKVVRPVPGCLDKQSPDCWTPMINARATGVYGFSRTDTDGYIQAEVLSGTREIVFSNRELACVVTLPVINVQRNILFYDEDLRCIERPPETLDMPVR